MDAYDRRRYGVGQHAHTQRDREACPDCGAGVQPWSLVEPLTWWCPQCRTEWADAQIVRPKGSAQR